MTKPGVISIQVNNNEFVWNQKNGKKGKVFRNWRIW